jgi:hypothetical protein
MEGERRRLCRRKELGKNIPNPFHWERRDSFSTAQQSVEAREFFGYLKTTDGRAIITQDFTWQDHWNWTTVGEKRARSPDI